MILPLVAGNGSLYGNSSFGGPGSALLASLTNGIASQGLVCHHWSCWQVFIPSCCVLKDPISDRL